MGLVQVDCEFQFGRCLCVARLARGIGNEVGVGIGVGVDKRALSPTWRSESQSPSPVDARSRRATTPIAAALSDPSEPEQRGDPLPSTISVRIKDGTRQTLNFRTTALQWEPTWGLCSRASVIATPDLQNGCMNCLNRLVALSLVLLAHVGFQAQRSRSPEPGLSTCVRLRSASAAQSVGRHQCRGRRRRTQPRGRIVHQCAGNDTFLRPSHVRSSFQLAMLPQNPSKPCARMSRVPKRST